MKTYLYLFLLVFIPVSIQAQNYTSYFTGNISDSFAESQGGVCMMGGATEQDDAMKWFLNQANGGDILVLRASGSDGYNDYMFTELGININSVESIVFNDATAGDEVYIHQKIQQAEAIWFAGGNQWNYVSYWRNNTMETLINEAIQERNIVIGGTSAGMAILGQLYFSAENGTVTSSEALNNPYDSDVTVDSIGFLQTPFLQNTITDSHYDDPDRKGRHSVFLARIFQDWGINAKGIACNEYVAVCIDTDGIAHVYGEYPDYEEYAYFLQINCELENPLPENCSANTPLNWNKNGEAIKVYKVPGTLDGSNNFDLNNWLEGNGGTWYNWHIDNGVFNENIDDAPVCTTSSEDILKDSSISIYPNPSNNGFIEIKASEYPIEKIIIRDISGREISSKELNNKFSYANDEVLEQGIYLISVYTKKGIFTSKLLVL
ncbi:MAG: cyanophycinase-like exopeptidase [Maribacter sp.]|jgi:cyanophycinase-like exopeptidase